MQNTALFEWEGGEFESNPKSADWYWALGIIAVAAAIAAILFSNYLFAVLIIIAAVVTALHGSKRPSIHKFSVTEQGLFIGEELYTFDNMISFSVLEDIEGDLPPVLSIKTENWMTPHLMIPLSGVDADALYDFLLHHIDESEHHHAFSDVVASWIGF